MLGGARFFGGEQQQDVPKLETGGISSKFPRWLSFRKTAPSGAGFRAACLWMSILLAAVTAMFAISVNGGRMNDLAVTTAQIQEISDQVARNPTAPAVADELSQLRELRAKRDSSVGTINWGKGDFFKVSYAACLATNIADCFHKNSSETNTIIIAFAAGVIGSGIFILRSIIRAAGAASDSELTSDLDFRGFSRLLFGGIVGLLALFFVRGTKGALLSPISGVVQVDNPYGTAFLSVIIVLFFDRFFDFLDRWMSQLKLGGSDGAGDTAQVTAANDVKLDTAKESDDKSSESATEKRAA